MTQHAVATARLAMAMMAIVTATVSCGSETISTGSASSVTTPTTTEPPPTSKPRTDTPDFVGAITAVTPGRPVTLMVEASRREPVGTLGGKASLRVDDATQIWTCGPTDGPVEGGVDQLTVGMAVSVWMDGPVAESYPVQATASAIHVGPGCG